MASDRVERDLDVWGPWGRAGREAALRDGLFPAAPAGPQGTGAQGNRK